MPGNNKALNFQNKAAASRMAASYRKQFGLGLDGLPLRRGRKSKATVLSKHRCDHAALSDAGHSKCPYCDNNI